MIIRSSFVFIALLLAAAGALSQARQPAAGTGAKSNTRPAATPTPADGDVIRVDTQIVSVPVRVMDRGGRFVAGLTQDKFKVFEDGVEQQIAMFSNEHEPFTVALVLDMSYSAKFKIAEIQQAAIDFIDQLRPEDRVLVVSFDGDVHVLCEATHDRQAIYRAIRSTKIGTGTSLYEAIDTVFNGQMRRIEGRKAIILFTDGVDTTSQRVAEEKNLADAMELDSLVYPIRYDTFEDVQRMTQLSQPGVSVGAPRGTSVEDYRVAAEYLEQLAIRTGGREYLADSVTNLSDAFSKIANELREFYGIGYYPTKERVPGQKATVKVKVDGEGLVVQARPGFLGPQRGRAK